MGLLDDPLGTIFGGAGDQGVVDKRANREPEGQRWWEKWESLFGTGGTADPTSLYAKALQSLEQPPVTLNFGGQRISVQPKSGQRQAQAYLGLLQPWMEGGMELERGRYGQPYYQAPDSGLLGGLVGSAGKMFGAALGGWGAGKLGLLG